MGRPKRYHDFKRCPQCGGVMLVRFEKGYKQAVQTDTCQMCGMVITSKRESEIFIVDEAKGYGCGAFLINRAATSVMLEDIAEKEDLDEWIMRCKNNPEIDWSVSYLTRWNDAKGTVDLVYGKEPESYDALIERINEVKGDFSQVSYGISPKYTNSAAYEDDDDIPF